MYQYSSIISIQNKHNMVDVKKIVSAIWLQKNSFLFKINTCVFDCVRKNKL